MESTAGDLERRRGGTTVVDHMRADVLSLLLPSPPLVSQAAGVPPGLLARARARFNARASCRTSG
jgi:hypothetical protein